MSPILTLFLLNVRYFLMSHVCLTPLVGYLQSSSGLSICFSYSGWLNTRGTTLSLPHWLILGPLSPRSFRICNPFAYRVSWTLLHLALSMLSVSATPPLKATPLLCI
uniref:Secreted protein n=1 Tax=Cacopsylla melanoneura TaxID=428564 RepID=A0A8D9AWB7_9HEMI